MKYGDKKSAQSLVDFTQQVAQILISRGLEKNTAIIISTDVALFLGRSWQGGVVIPHCALAVMAGEIATHFSDSAEGFAALSEKHILPLETINFILENTRLWLNKAGHSEVIPHVGIKNFDCVGLLLDVVIQVTKNLMVYGVNKPKAVKVALFITEYVANHWGGSLIYLSHKQLAICLVKAEITANPHMTRPEITKLSRKYHVTASHIYFLCQENMKRQTEPEQHDTMEHAENQKKENIIQ